MGIRKVQSAFMGGEISPAMYGRFDDKKYGQALAVCRNFIARPQGPLTNRPGFSFVREVKHMEKPTRLLPFQFSATQTMVVELGEKYARFHTNGQTLLGDGGEPYEIETPYEARDVMEIRYVQAGDVLTLVHTAYPPMELRRYGPTDWRMVPVSFKAAVTQPQNLNGSFSVVAKKNVEITEEEKTRYTLKYKVTAVKGGKGSDGIDNEESFPSEVCEVKGNLYLDNALVTLNWSSVEGADRYRVYKSYKGLYGFIGETKTTTFTDDNYKADEERTPPMYDDPFSQNKGIKSVKVLDGGHGYSDRGAEIEYQLSIDEDKDSQIDSVASWLSQWNEYRFDEHERVSKRPIIFYTGSYVSNGVSVSGTEDYYQVEGYWNSLPPVENKSYRLMPDLLVPIKDANGGTGKGGIARVKARVYMGKGGRRRSGKHTTILRRIILAVCVDKVSIEKEGNGYLAPTIDWKNIDYSPWGVLKNAVDMWTFNGQVIQVDYHLDNVDKYYRLKSQPSTLFVKDETGYGAVLEPVVEGGAIKSVNIRYPGVNYSRPEIVSRSLGTGARFEITVADVGDYPSAVAYLEQRRVFGGTTSQPQSLWMTRSGTESDMTYTLPAKDDNRIKFRIAAQEASRIQHIVPLSQLVVLTTGTEFRVTSVNSDAITPKSISVKPQSYIGASEVQPVIVNSSMVYAAARGGHVRELGYSFQAQGFVSGDLSLRAAHLFERNRVTSLTLQKAPDPVVWCAMSNGELLGFTYMPDQGIGGWHRHDTLGGKFEAVTCVTEGEQDVLYAVVRRLINGQYVRYIERMGEQFNGDPVEAFYVDCGATYRGKPTKRITGLRWLEGETVAVLGDGGVLPQARVKDGAIELEQEVSVAHIGLPIVADIKTLPVVLQLNDGSFGQGHSKNINKLWAQVYQSSGFKAGMSFDKLIETKPRFEEPYGTSPTLFSGEVSLAPSTGWSTDGALCLRQDNPLPLTLVSLTWQFM